jgi:hypothetical protein
MKNLELLPIAEEKKKRLSKFDRMYRQNARIFTDVVSFEDNSVILRVEQKERVNNVFLTRKELVERARKMVKDELPDNWKIIVSAVDSNRDDIDKISPDWIKNRMKKLGIKAKHICKNTGIDKSTISSVLNGENELTKWHKTAFYYMFKYNETAHFA